MNRSKSGGESRKTSIIAKTIIIAAIVIAALCCEILTGYFIGKGIRTAWDVCYEMTNSRIEWTGAGNNGIYGR